MNNPLSHLNSSPVDVLGLPQSNVPLELDDTQNKQKIKITVKHQKQSEIDVSELPEKLGSLPILSEFDLRTPEDQKALARQVAAIVAGAAKLVADSENKE